MKARTNRHGIAWMGLFILAATLASAIADDKASTKTSAEKSPKEGVEKPRETSYVRFVDEKTGGPMLQAGVGTYVRKDGARVHLVGALHLGEKEYYAHLEKDFESYDALLYELVKEKGVDMKELVRRKREGDAPLSFVSSLQIWMKNVLELEFQLDAIDYTRDNFVHADLDAERFFELQKEKGESIFTLILRSMKHELERQARGEKVAQITLVDLLRVFLSDDRSRELKIVLGRQFNSIEDTLAGIEGPNGSVILTERNKVAIEVLQKTLKAGKRTIGIFYGAGHMQDLEKRIEELGFERVAFEWRTAWDMRTTAQRDATKKTEDSGK